MSMMKKRILPLLFCLLMVITAAGCDGGQALSRRNNNELTGVKEVLEKRMREEMSGTEDMITEQQGSESSAADNELQSVGDSEPYEVWNDPEFDESRIPVADYKSTDGIDVDLTQLSANMVYAEVFYMMTVPENYIGKTVRMEGQFATYQDEDTGKMYYACIIRDATACCAQGMEFITSDERSYPEDYPKEGDEISVVGVFDTYEEGEETYAVIRDSELTKIT